MGHVAFNIFHKSIIVFKGKRFKLPRIKCVFPVNLAMDSSTNSALAARKSGRICFGKLMKEVTDKQQELHLRFLDTIETREKDRVATEEAWKA